MRVSPDTQAKTRQRILDVARARFETSGFDGATTRELATAAGIAAGTLFNYFRTKEAIGLALVSESVATAEIEFAESRRSGETVQERLFAHVAIQLRHLLPVRAWLADVAHQAFSPLRGTVAGEETGADELRRRHLEIVATDLRECARLSTSDAESPVLLHLYWSLYLGVLGFWIRDDSHNQEASLALLDRSIRLFCQGLPQEQSS